jgi:hypothetical protein
MAVVGVFLAAFAAGCALKNDVDKESMTPSQIVTLFHESYGTAWMDDIGPYTTADFRDQLPV